MRQRMKLTRTNRSCGLTTYFFHSEDESHRGGATQRPMLRFEARREKGQVIAFRNTTPFPR